jgi:hypothetical protein
MPRSTPSYPPAISKAQKKLTFAEQLEKVMKTLSSKELAVVEQRFQKITEKTTQQK